VTRWSNKREPPAIDGEDRASGGQAGGLPGGRSGRSVRVEPRLLRQGVDAGDVARDMDALDLLACRPRPLDEVEMPLQELQKPSRALGMVARRVQMPEGGMADHLDDAASSSLPASPPSPSELARLASAAQSGSISGSGGIGAERSSAARRR